MLGEDVEAGCSGTSYRRRGNWKLTRTRKQAGDGKIHSPIESIQSLNCDVIKLAAASLPCGKSWAYGNGEIRQCYGRGWWRRWSCVSQHGWRSQSQREDEKRECCFEFCLKHDRSPW